MKKINIALDGYAGCGKSTTARLVARHLHYLFLDTGSMYRAFTLNLLRMGVPYTDLESVTSLLQDTQISFQLHPETKERQTLLNDEVVDAHLRTQEVNAVVSEVSAIKVVRTAMVAQQQRIAKGKGVVMDGRDIGTVVLPHAELKIFMTASLEARIVRRTAELHSLGQPIDPLEVRRSLLHRDHIDTTRIQSPLRRAPDALLLDSTHLQIDEQVAQVLAWAHERKVDGPQGKESFAAQAR